MGIVTWSPDGKHLAAVGHDGVIRVWTGDLAAELLRFVVLRDGSWVAIDASGRHDHSDEREISGVHGVRGITTIPLAELKGFRQPGLLPQVLGAKR